MPGSSPRSIRLARLCATIGLAVLATACATASPSQKAGLRPRETAQGEPALLMQAQPRPAPDASLYGLFLAGEAALDRGSSVDAAGFLGRASEIEPDPYLKERAFTAAVVAGEIDRAAAVPLVAGQGSLAADRLDRLVRAVEALATNHPAQSYALLTGEPPAGQTAQAVVLLAPWAAAAAGDWTAALTPAPATATDAPQLTVLFAAFDRSRLLERNGRLGEAETLLKTLSANPDDVAFVLGYGAFLERRGRRTEAVALYDRTLARTRDVDVVAARDRAKAGRPAPTQPSLQEGAGEALLAPAATLISRRQPELGLALMRLALRLDPKLDDAWMAVGDAMAAAGDADAAAGAYRQIAASSSKYGDAESRLAWILQKAGDSDGALTMARSWLERSKNDPEALSLYGDLLRENGRFEESVEVMDRLIAQNGAGEVEPWRLYFLRGISFEQSGRWDKAEPDLEQALKLNPAEPEIMNYLGFGWANRSQHLDQALELLQKAVALRPNSGEIRDSLGWAKYRQGHYADAVRDLERAVGLAPAEPDVNDHLGDAYWRVGRKLEAEFQWRRVLSLNPDEKLKAAVDAKLQGGLDAVAASPGAVAAAAPAAPAAAQP